MLKKILLVFAILIGLLILIFILINIFYPLDKYSNTSYQAPTTENKKTENPISNNTPEVKTQLFTNKDYNYSFSYPTSLECKVDNKYQDLYPKNNVITCAPDFVDPSFAIFIVASKTDKTPEDIANKLKQEASDNVTQGISDEKLTVTDEIIAKQATKKIISTINSGNSYDEIYFLKYQANMYKIEYYTTSNDKTGLQYFQTILDSFQFTK